MVLVMAICVQIKTIEKATKSVGSTLKDNTNLRDELLNKQGKYESLYKKLEDKEKELERVRLKAAAKNETDIANETEIKNNQKILGLTEISGPGYIISLDEKKDIKIDDVLNINGYIVHEEDLLYIVNELFNAGADAVSINNQRIVSTTSILCDGNIIRINGKMVGTPITIKAIGYPERIDGALNRPGGYLQLMANDGVEVYVEKSDKINIPKYEGVYNYEYLLRGDI